MKSLMQLFQEKQNRNPRSTPRQLELPLGGTRLSKEEWAFLGELRRVREQIARIPTQTGTV